MSSMAVETSHSRAAASREAGLILRPIRGDSDAPPIPLAVGRHVIGSASDADVRLEVQGIDARHAVLLVGPQRSVLKAFSRFTWVNDGVVRECTVKPGDRICLGPVEFEVLKGKSRRRRSAPPAQAVERAVEVQPTPARELLDSLSLLPHQALVSRDMEEASRRRRQVIAELNGELLSQLSHIVERETVASDRERRILEQSAQLEGRRRILEDRHTDFEQLRADLSRVETDWRRKSTELSEQALQLKLERDSLNRDRESLNRDRARMTEEAARLAAQSQAVEQRRESLDAREARLEEQRSALDLRATQLNLQEQRHSAAVAQALISSQSHAEDVQRLATQKAAFQQQAEQLRQEREQLDSERAQYESDRDKLFAERAHLATREVEIAELRRQLHEQQAEFASFNSHSQEIAAAAAAQSSPTDEAAAQLAQREQQLVEQEAALLVERNDLDQRKREIDEQHAAWMLERHTLAAKTNSEEREAAQAANAEIGMLRTQISELQSRLREERMVWQQERLDLESRAEAAAAEIHQPLEPTSLGDDLSFQVAELQALLEKERSRHQLERESWESEQDLLLRDRQALEAEWRRLESRAEAFNPTAHAAISPEVAEVVPPPIPAHFHDPVDSFETFAAPDAWEAQSSFDTVSDGNEQQSDPADASQSWAHDQPAPAGDQQIDFGDEQSMYSEDADGRLTGNGSQPEAEATGFVQYADDPVDMPYSGSQYDPASFGESDTPAEYDSADAQEISFEHSSLVHEDVPAGSGDVLSLRAQLAEMFGIQSSPDEDANQDGSYADGNHDMAGQYIAEGDDLNATEMFSAEVPVDPASSDAVADGFGEQPGQGFEETPEAGDQTDEQIMSAYLARLLKKSPDPQENTLKTIAVPQQSNLTETAASEQNAEEQEPQKPTRRLNAEEKETLRANLDSFREIANQQARAAVAKHKSNELKSGMQTTSVVAILVSVVGAILISAEFWTSQSYRLYGIACLAVSGGLGVYTVINGMRIRRLKAVARSAADITEALGDDEPDPAPEKSE